MNGGTIKNDVKTNWRWYLCALLFVATTVNYLDRQVLSLTWKDFIAPEFHWTDTDYGMITGWFSLPTGNEERLSARHHHLVYRCLPSCRMRMADDGD